MITEFNSTHLDDEIAHTCGYNTIGEARYYAKKWKDTEYCQTLRVRSKSARRELEEAGHTDITRKIDRLCNEKFPTTMKNVDQRLNNTSGIAGRGPYQQTLHDKAMVFARQLHRTGCLDKDKSIIENMVDLTDAMYQAEKEFESKVG